MTLKKWRIQAGGQSPGQLFKIYKTSAQLGGHFGHTNQYQTQKNRQCGGKPLATLTFKLNLSN